MERSGERVLDGAMPEGARAQEAPPERTLPEAAPPEAAPGGAPPGGTLPDGALAAALAARLERIVSMLRTLSQPNQMSFTSAATLGTLDRDGPSRLTALAAREGVSQPAMTQLIDRLQGAGLVSRVTDPDDGRVVLVRITDEGRALLNRRRALRTERLAVLVGQLPPEHRAALEAALPAIDALASARPGQPVPA